MRSFVEMVKGRWREFVREPSAFFFVVFMPILWMAILGYGIGTPRAVVYGVAWESKDRVGGSLHDALAHHPQVRLKDGNGDDVATWLKRGDVLLVIRPDASGLTFIYDPANREAAHARMAVGDLAQAAAGRADVLKMSDETVSVPGTRYIDFLVPGLLALSIMTTSLFGTGVVIVVSRRENLLKRYLATPMQPFAYIASHIVGRGLMLAAEIATVLIAGWLMFGFKVAGSYTAFVAVAMLGAATFTALAVLCGSRTANMAVMNGTTNLISLPMMMVAGVWFARSNFPEWTADPLRFLPLTALVDALRRIALEGAGLASLTFEMGVLAVYLVIAAVLARVLFKWY